MDVQVVEVRHVRVEHGEFVGEDRPGGGTERDSHALVRSVRKRRSGTSSHGLSASYENVQHRERFHCVRLVEDFDRVAREVAAHRTRHRSSQSVRQSNPERTDSDSERNAQCLEHRVLRNDVWDARELVERQVPTTHAAKESGTQREQAQHNERRSCALDVQVREQRVDDRVRLELVRVDGTGASQTQREKNVRWCPRQERSDGASETYMAMSVGIACSGVIASRSLYAKMLWTDSDAREPLDLLLQIERAATPDPTHKRTGARASCALSTQLGTS